MCKAHEKALFTTIALEEEIERFKLNEDTFTVGGEIEESGSLEV